MENLSFYNDFEAAAQSHSTFQIVFIVFFVCMIIGAIVSVVFSFKEIKQKRLTEEAKASSEKMKALAALLTAKANVAIADEKAKDSMLLNLNREILAKAKLDSLGLDELAQKVHSTSSDLGKNALDAFNAQLETDDFLEELIESLSEEMSEEKN